jgi:hypothetical protein
MILKIVHYYIEEISITGHINCFSSLLSLSRIQGLAQVELLASSNPPVSISQVVWDCRSISQCMV